MEDIAFIFGQGPQIYVGIVDEELNALDVVLQNGIMESCVAFLALEVDVIGVSNFLQDVF